MRKKISSWALILTISMLTILLISMFGIALANASDENADEGIMSNGESLFGFLAPQANPVLGGISIYNSEGNPATENFDFTVDNEHKILYLLSNELTVTGGSDKGPINARIEVNNQNNNINQLTLENLHIYDKTKDKDTLYIKCPSTGSSTNPDFTLTMKGASTIYQAEGEGGRQALRIEGGEGNGFDIKGERDADNDATFEIYAYYMDAIFVNSDEPVTFTGTMDALVYSERDDGIDWAGEGDHASLTFKDHARVAFGSEHVHKYSAIDCGSLYVKDFASLIAICNNESSKDVPAINTIDDFVVDTAGSVFVDAYNDWSWQAIDCNNLTINKCERFYAIAQDYPAIVCNGDFIISKEAAPHIYLSGGFKPKTDSDHRAIRGAFTVKHPENFKVGDGYLMYGSEDKLAEVDNIYSRAFATFTSGYPKPEANTYEYDVYTPAIRDWTGLNLAKYANTVVFDEGKDVTFVPGKKADYNKSGYKDCYKYKDENTYFEDYDLQIPIENYNQWKSEGGAGYLPSVSQDFESYREYAIGYCDLMLERGDRPEIPTLINAAKEAMRQYVYDVKLTLLQNKANLDAIYAQLETDADNLPLPVPGQDIPANGNAQTGDSLPFWIGLILALIAIATAAIVIRKRYVLSNKLGVHNTSTTAFSVKFITILVIAIMLPLMLLSGVAIANATNNDKPITSSVVSNNSLFANFIPSLFSNQEYFGVTITKDGQDAQKDVDFEVDETNQVIKILKNGLTVSGGTQSNPVDVSIITDKPVTDLTISNLYINTAREYIGPRDGHVLMLDWEAPSGSDTKNFLLNVKGTCGLVQSNKTKGGSAINILNEQGYGCNIHGESNSKLYCYSDYYEGIFVHKGPLQISGDLEATIEAPNDRCIAWQEGVHDTDILALTDNAYVTCIASNAKHYPAIQAGDLAVLHNSSLEAYNNNGTDNDKATLNIRYFIGINTTGKVWIGNVSQKSWQAIRCKTLSILNCSDFIAFSSDYSAIECTNSITIQTPNVIICGEYNREASQNKARRGAITIEDPNKIYISPDLMAFGSDEAYNVEDAEDLCFMTKTAGEDIPETESLYTPVVCHNNVATIAKTIRFASAAHTSNLISGAEPTYFSAGYKDCYQCSDCGIYFEDAQSQNRIANLDLWRTLGGNGYIAPLKDNFDPYRARMVDACNNMFVKGDIPEIRAMIAAAQAKIDAYVYDEGMSLATNKAAIDKIYYELYDEVMNYSPYNSSEVIVETAQTGDNLMIYIFVFITLITIAGTGILVSRNY